MTPSSAEERFREYAGQSGAELTSLKTSEGIDLMLKFYRDERAEGCPIDEDGDMLLFQWGVYDRGGGEHFELNVTRQFLEMGNEEEDEDGPISQLSLTFRFLPDEPLRTLPRGNRWCESPAELADFRSFIEGCRAWEEAQKREPATVTLHYYGEV